MKVAGPSFIDSLAAKLGAQRIETHISWVLLAGADAYKIKKPLRLSFVDYNTPIARRRFCEEELRLNRRLAPSLYLDVARITGDALHAQIGGSGRVIEYAVHMRRFPEDALFSQMLRDGTLHARHIDALALRIAEFHAAVSRDVPDVSYGSPWRRLKCAMNALEGVRADMPWRRYKRLREWMNAEAHKLLPVWLCRRAQGRVRECHGDLHLANLIDVDGEVTGFDCIEFDPALRWIDVADDIAFTVMDLDAWGRRDLAFRFLDASLDHTGDHACVPALRFSLVYRALVRAHVASLRGDASLVTRYLDAAMRWMESAAPALTITHGLPGSGKTFHSQRTVEGEGAIRLRSDVERKRLFGLHALESSRGHGVDIYTPEAGERTYAHLFATARMLLHAGFPVVIDAAFLRRDERERARSVARDLNARFSILDCDAPVEVLRARLRARTSDASEADLAVLEKLRRMAQPLSAKERRALTPALSPGERE